jgi:hypothetical protein
MNFNAAKAASKRTFRQHALRHALIQNIFDTNLFAQASSIQAHRFDGELPPAASAALR